MKIEQKDWLIPFIYLILGVFWISLSDNLLFFMNEKFNWSTETVNAISKWKGILYVIITATLLYFLIKRKTHTLKLIKNDFQRLFQDNPNPMYIFEVSTQNILLANKAASSQYGYSSNEMSQLNLKDLRPYSEQARLQQHLKNLKEEFTDSGELLHMDKAGNYFYVNIFSHKTIYKGKECRIVNAININDKILAEIERENFQKALNKAALVSITGINGNIQEVNSEFCRVSGFSRKELVGQPIKVLESGYHTSNFWNEMWTQIKAGELWRADIKNKNKAGKEYWVDIVISPIKNHDGEIYKFMSISYDITEKKKLEHDQKNLLEDFTEYAFQTSHELRGPLTSMMGLTTIFEKYDDPSYVINKLKATAKQMDAVIRKMNESLSRTALNLIQEKRENQSSG
ncbi:PAS domain S-box protein [Marivirga arenosa]|uniref:histidine kinase n=1 Tax=Marivirga arenosa TaxID=3059076 RepID=A0AA51ZX62_9BACT|nr:PAS domain S-box protein [Marivirga sp. BKB1-2]WNB18362.1 PAS domain S-box protein [Marivirga sp. BKB1-2]